jgi:hypothetical protein
MNRKPVKDAGLETEVSSRKRKPKETEREIGKRKTGATGRKGNGKAGHRQKDGSGGVLGVERVRVVRSVPDGTCWFGMQVAKCKERTG